MQVRSSRSKLTAYSVAAISVLALAPAVASADWSTPMDVSQGGESIFSVSPAFSPDGTLHMAWDNNAYGLGGGNTVRYGSVTPDGTVVASQQLSIGAGGAAPDLAARPDGSALIAWTSDGNIDWAIARADGTITPPAHVDSATDTTQPSVTVDSNGVGTIAWTDRSGSNEVRYARVSAGGDIGSVQVAGTSDSDDVPQLAADGHGNTILAWAQTADPEVFELRFARIDAAGAAGPEHVAATTAATPPRAEPPDAQRLRLAVNSAGAILVTTTVFVSGGYGPASSPSDFYGFYVVVPTGSDAGTARAFHPTDNTQSMLLVPALYEDGRGLIAGAALNGTDQGLDLLPVAADGSPGTGTPVFSTFWVNREPALVMDDQGVATLVWSGFSPNEVSAVRISPSGTVGSQQDFPSSYVGAQAAAVDRFGDAAALWASSGEVLKLAIFNKPASCDDGSATVEAGALTLLALPCVGRAPLSFAFTDTPSHGHAVLDAATGAVVYTPDSGYTGTDSFTYSATNDAGASETKTFTVNVVPARTAGKAGGALSLTVTPRNLARKGSKRRALKATFSLPAPAEVKLTIRRTYGRKVGKSCRETSTVKTSGHKRCELGTGVFSAALGKLGAGSTSMSIPAKTVRTLLRPGAYQLVLEADGKTVAQRFTVRWH